MPTLATVKEYDARVDSKKRVTLRGENAGFFHVTHRKDGVTILKPRKLVDAPLSEKTLRGMIAAFKNLRAGKRSKPVDLKKLAAMKI
jgi:hypothetical protein